MSDAKQSKFSRNLFLACVVAGVAAAAIAGTDATFGNTTTGIGPLGKVNNWLTGSMGKLFAIGALAIGLGIGIVKQSAMSAAVGVGIALSSAAGPAVLAAMFTAAL